MPKDKINLFVRNGLFNSRIITTSDFWIQQAIWVDPVAQIKSSLVIPYTGIILENPQTISFPEAESTKFTTICVWGHPVVRDVLARLTDGVFSFVDFSQVSTASLRQHCQIVIVFPGLEAKDFNNRAITSNKELFPYRLQNAYRFGIPVIVHRDFFSFHLASVSISSGKSHRDDDSSTVEDPDDSHYCVSLAHMFSSLHTECREWWHRLHEFRMLSEIKVADSMSDVVALLGCGSPCLPSARSILRDVGFRESSAKQNWMILVRKLRFLSDKDAHGTIDHVIRTQANTDKSIQTIWHPKFEFAPLGWRSGLQKLFGHLRPIVPPHELHGVSVDFAHDHPAVVQPNWIGASAEPLCIIYSIGIANDWAFDESAIQMWQNCQVFMFDPSENYSVGDLPSARMHFFPLGVQGGTDKNNSAAAEWLSSRRGMKNNDIILLSLGQMMELLDHDYVDYVKVDCEGCEWSALFSTPNSILHRIGQISVEGHLAYTYQVSAADTIDMMAGLVHHLESANFKLVRSTPEQVDSCRSAQVGQLYGANATRYARVFQGFRAELRELACSDHTAYNFLWAQ